MKLGMNIINGLPEFFTEDEEFVRKPMIIMYKSMI